MVYEKMYIDTDDSVRNEQVDFLYKPITYKYVSTKEYHNAFPCAYRQYKADSHCNLIHGYSFSMRFFFGCDTLDARNWCADLS